jgi:hypothetical protein
VKINSIRSFVRVQSTTARAALWENPAWDYDAETVQDSPLTNVDGGDNDGSTETTDGDGSSVSISGSFPVNPGVGVGNVVGSPSGAAGLLAALDELHSAEIPGSPSGIDWSELPSLSIDYQPDTRAGGSRHPHSGGGSRGFQTPTLRGFQTPTLRGSRHPGSRHPHSGVPEGFQTPTLRVIGGN